MNTLRYLVIALLSLGWSMALTAGLPKILVLIITSDDLPVYLELQKVWRAYMHLDPEHVEAYFIRSNPNLDKEFRIDGDTIWARSVENIMPGLTNKTILSLEAMLPRLSEFDYVLRTNLSSFYVFPKLLQFLENKPKKGFYGGSDIGDPRIGSGCGFILSTDLARLLVAHKSHFINNLSGNDDVVIGWFLNGRGIPLIRHLRVDFFDIAMWNQRKDNIPAEAFQFRVKNNNPSLRLAHDVLIHQALLNKYYGISLTRRCAWVLPAIRRLS